MVPNDYMSRLKPKSTEQQGYSFCFIGAHGTGKTSIVDDPELKILYLPFEYGEASLPDRPNIVMYESPNGAMRYIDVLETLEWLEASPNNRAQFDLVVLDGLGRFFELTMQHALEITPQVSRMAPGVPQKADWNHFPRLFKDIIKRFHELTKLRSNKKPFHVAFIGHTKDDKDEVSGIVAQKISLPGSDTGDVVGSVVDMVGYQTILHMVPKEKQKDENAKPEKHYVLFLKPTRLEGKEIHAKVRAFKGVAHKIPSVMKNPSIRRLLNMMEYLRAEQQKLVNPNVQVPENPEPEAAEEEIGMV